MRERRQSHIQIHESKVSTFILHKDNPCKVMVLVAKENKLPTPVMNLNPPANIVQSMNKV